MKLLIAILPVLPLVLFIIGGYIGIKKKYKMAVHKGYKGSFNDYIKIKKVYNPSLGIKITNLKNKDSN